MSRKKTKKNVGTLEELATYCGQDLSSRYGVDSIAFSVLECLENKVSDELWDMLFNMMLGFNDEMQLEIADDLADFACDHIINTTGCFSADSVLVFSYKMIAEEQGFDSDDIEKILKKVM